MTPTHSLSDKAEYSTLHVISFLLKYKRNLRVHLKHLSTLFLRFDNFV